MDLFYLSDDISAKSNYKYVVRIIDHFSKWIWSYEIKEKTAHDCLLCLMHYVYPFGCPKKLHTDNGKEFKNIHFDIFCSDNNKNQVFSKPYNPKSNGCIEASHKEIKQYINAQFYIDEKENFDLNEVLLNAIYTHNNSIHNTTNYKPVDLKDISDPDIINLVKSNMEIKINKKIMQIIKSNKKAKGDFTIPAIFVEFNKNNKLKIKIAINYKKLLIKDQI